MEKEKLTEEKLKAKKREGKRKNMLRLGAMKEGFDLFHEVSKGKIQ